MVHPTLTHQTDGSNAEPGASKPWPRLPRMSLSYYLSLNYEITIFCLDRPSLFLYNEVGLQG